VLFFDRGDFGVELARQRIGKQRPDIHIVVVRLVFARDDRQRVQFGQEGRAGGIVRGAQIVRRGTVVRDRGAPVQYVGIALQDVAFCVE
jgi:hypothetical protein